MTPTRKKETTGRYENRVALLLANYQLGTPRVPTLSGYAAWLRDRRIEMSAASFRQYRSASISVFGAILELDSLDASVRAEVQRAIGMLCSTRRTQLSPRRQILPRTSALKQKRIDAQDWEKLTAALLVSERRHARLSSCCSPQVSIPGSGLPNGSTRSSFRSRKMNGS